MFKKITLLTVLMAFNMLAFAQYSNLKLSCNNQNPGDLNKDLETLPMTPQGYTKIMGGSAVPIWSSILNIPFTFNLAGTNFTSFKVSTTGILTFNVATVAVPDSNNQALPSALIPDNSICIWGIVGRPGGWNDSVGTKTFGVAPNRQHWISFFSYSRAGSTGTGYTYWSIVLEETTNNVYIVDQRTAPSGSLTVTAGIQINSTTAYQVAASPNLASGVITTNTGLYDPSDNITYVFSSSLLSYDLRPKSLSLQNSFPYRDLSIVPYPINGAITNLGTQNITTMVLNYSVDGGPVVSSAPLTVNVTAGACYNYSHPTPWTPATSGWHVVKLWASNLNGANADQNTANDTVVAKVYAYAAKPDVHKVVIEEGTGTWCGWCPRGTVYMDSIHNVYPNSTVLIAVHGGYTSEPMRVAAYDNGMSDLIPGDPYILVNRAFGDDPSEAFSLYGSHLNDFGLADVGVFINYNGTTRQSTVSATIISAVDIDGDYRLMCVYTEDNVTGPGDGTNVNDFDYDQQNYYSVSWNTANGNTPPGPLSGAGHDWAASNNPVPATIMEYDFVARALQGGFTGQVGSLPAVMTDGGVYTYQFPAYTIPASYNVSNMKAHVLLIDATNKVIMNANSMALASVGISNPSQGLYDVAVSPNPAVDQLNVHLNFKESDQVNLVITDLLGKVCHSEELGTIAAGEQLIPVDIRSLSSGTYFISLIGNNGKATTKFVK